MLLGDVRDYVMQRDSVTLHDVMAHFDITNDTARFALDYWINKNQISQSTETCASSCGGCSSGADTYQWVKTEFPLKWVGR
jgi:hypothetical protein